MASRDALRVSVSEKLAQKKKNKAQPTNGIGFTDAIVALWLRELSSSENVALGIERWLLDQEMTQEEYGAAVSDLCADMEEFLNQHRIQDPEDLALFRAVEELRAKWSAMKDQYLGHLDEYMMMNHHDVLMFHKDKGQLCKNFRDECLRLQVCGPFYATQVGHEDEQNFVKGRHRYRYSQGSSCSQVRALEECETIGPALAIDIQMKFPV
jgi:hypothetical protein